MLSLQAKALLALVLFAVLSAALWAFGERRYRAGEAHVQAVWDAEKVVQQQAALEAERQHRATEQNLQSDYREVQNAYEVRHANDAVLIAGSSAALDGLRQRLAASASRGAVPQDPRDRSGADDEATRLRGDLVECAEHYRQLGSEAASYSEQVEALQTIIKAAASALSQP